MTSSQCRLCLERESETIDIFETESRVSFEIIIYKLFSLRLGPSDMSTAICSECNRSLLECYAFYERVDNAQKEFLKNEGLIPLESIKKEDAKEIDEVHDYGDDVKNDVIDDFDLKEECKQDYTFSDDDDIVLDKYLSLLDSEKVKENIKESTNIVKTKKKYKKRKKVLDSGEAVEKKKKKLKKIQNGLISDDLDPNILLDSEGLFIVKGQALEDMVNKFFNLDCNTCSHPPKIKSVRALLEHYNSKHNTKGYVICCGTKFDTRKKINYHFARHVQPSAFECHICKRSVARPRELRNHIMTHLPESERPLQCEECGKGFIYASHLRQHKMSHLPVEKRKIYHCKLCPKTFTLSTSYSVHVSSVHSRSKYLCSHCGRSFRDKINWRIHMRKHDPNPPNQSVQCKECGIILAHELGLKRHMRRHALTFSCTQCDYITHRNAELNKHIRVRHTDLKPHVCLVCGKGFKLKNSLKIHTAQHTGERNYSCPFCPRTFMDPANCYSHKKKMHPNEMKNMSKKKQKNITNIDEMDDVKTHSDNTEKMDSTSSEKDESIKIESPVASPRTC